MERAGCRRQKPEDRRQNIEYRIQNTEASSACFPQYAEVPPHVEADRISFHILAVSSSQSNNLISKDEYSHGVGLSYWQAICYYQSEEIAY